VSFIVQEQDETDADGRRIYFPQIKNKRAVLSQASIADGETSTLPIRRDIFNDWQALEKHR
jgi:hypothetical protein